MQVQRPSEKWGIAGEISSITSLDIQKPSSF